MKQDLRKVYRAAVYVRLSKEDTEKDVSDSIVNQKELIYDFIKCRTDIEPAGEFIDDGYSGVDFQRPAFLHLLREIEAGRVDCIVVKDAYVKQKTTIFEIFFCEHLNHIELGNR